MRRPLLSAEFCATGGFYLVLVALAGLGFLAYKTAGPESDVSSTVQVAAVVGALLLFLGLFLFFMGWRLAGPTGRVRFYAPVIVNGIVIASAFLLAEVVLRWVAEPDALGQRIGETVLVPYDWKHVAAVNRMELLRSRTDDIYLVDDRHLGWTVGTSRRSADGLYLSSTEGLRSRVQGETLMTVPHKRRVLLTGDSFAFSEEVPFEHSLGHHLEQDLGDQTQVVTVGVPGYGIDQAVMRYEAEAERWKPEVAVLQFIQDDINRIGNIYLFNKPAFAMPFVKPRFVEVNGELRLLDLPPPDEVYESETVFTLPHLEQDSDFQRERWEHLPLLTSSYVFRFLAARFPRYTVKQVGPSTNEALSVRLIERFTAAARRSGTVPVVVYFPSYGDLVGQDRTLAERVITRLQKQGIEVVNPSDCLRQAGDSKVLIVQGGVHYSDAGNGRMSKCLAPVLRRLLPEG